MLVADRAYAGEQLLAARPRICNQSFVLEDVHSGQRGDTCELAPAEGGRMRERCVPEGALPRVATRDKRTDRYDAAGEALRKRHNVRHDRVAIACKPIPTPSKAGLHFVGDEERTGAIAGFTDRAQISERRYVDAAFALYRLDDERGGIPERIVEQLGLRVRDCDNVGKQRTKGGLEGFASADRERAECLAVVGIERADDLGAPRRGARQLDRAFDRLGAAITPKRDP